MMEPEGLSPHESYEIYICTAVNLLTLSNLSLQIISTGTILGAGTLGGQSERHQLERAPERRGQSVWFAQEAACIWTASLLYPMTLWQTLLRTYES